ncbi:phage tail terminator protein [Sodalis sp. RH21]|uniref:phage tail terminator protein n=1 Tax=unclassified Sodalis (in: enterobacteria) TaxID=2636512 RepID=UPI0039B3EA8B
MKHPLIRAAVLGKLRQSVTLPKVTWYDGRPGFISPEDLPAVAVYLTDAKATGESIDEEEWRAVLHIEVFLKATATDSELDKWMEQRIYPAMEDVPVLAELLETISVEGYDYQRDDESTTWGSADLQYSLNYIM